MTKVKVEFESGEAMVVSCATEEYKRRLQKVKHNPNDWLAKKIMRATIEELRTAHEKVEEAIRNWRED